VANKEITFYTHPSTFGNGYFPESPPYDRIAGLMIDGETLWAKPSILAEENNYQRTDTEALTLTLPGPLAHTTADYFRDFYADPPHFYTVSNPFAERAAQSNCHRFGTTVWTNRPQGIHEATNIASQIISKNQRLSDAAPPLGQLVAFGTIEAENNLWDIRDRLSYHTQLSLGPDRYLQVMTFAGNMGLSHSLEETSAFYRGKHPPIEVFQSVGVEPLPADAQAVDVLRRAFG